MKSKEERHLCFRCGRKRSVTKLQICECGKTYWCKNGCKIVDERQWEKYNRYNNHGRVIVSI